MTNAISEQSDSCLLIITVFVVHVYRQLSNV